MKDQSQSTWEEHHHDAMVHSHPHYHVTHNYNEERGGFDHLSSRHEHEHDHGEITHSHYPHEDFDKEHAGEAHIHDHDRPVKKTAARKKSTAAKEGA